jgi:hypothetical protein
VGDNKSGVKAKGKLSKNKPAEMFPTLVQHCGFSNLEHFTSHLARHTGISMMVKSGVSQHILNQKVRHSNMAINSLCFDPHKLALADVSIALDYAPAGKYIVIDSILDTFVYSLFEF